MIPQFTSLLAAALLAGCSTESVAWSVPAGSVADPAYQAAAFTPPPNVFAGSIHVPAAAAMDHSTMDHSKMGHGAAAKPAAAAAVKGTGVVRAVDAASGTVKLAHDAIPAIGWPKMVMDFKVQPGVDLSALQANDNVAFTLKSTGGDEYAIASIAPDHAKHDHAQHGGTK